MMHRTSYTCCTWALRQAAIDQPRFNLKTKVERNFYVDNYLDSFDREEDAIEHAKKMTLMLKNKGFRLNQWLSSSREVLNVMPATERAYSKLDIDLDRLPTERTLGMYWVCEVDVFKFTFKLPTQVKTKREMFSASASIFDPLGCICPAVLPVKILMQDIRRRGISWNDLLSMDILLEWNKWCKDLVNATELRVPRCFRPAGFAAEGSEVQLYVFSDASKDGYGAVAYLRYAREGRIHVAFVMGKSRVAPVRQQTIPKLELNGAWTAVELARTVVRELDITISRKYFWTDSTTVLRWVNSYRSRLEEFVANRVTHILNHSEPEEWNHVPGTQNPADDCSREVQATQLTPSHRWFAGPLFLSQPEDKWPDQSTWRGEVSNEVATEVNALTQKNPCVIEALMAEATSLDALKLKVAQLSMEEEVPARPPGSKPSNVDFQSAMDKCIRATQKHCFKEDVDTLSKLKPLAKQSRLKSLNPYLDEKGIIRVGGRLEHAELQEETRFPAVIPHNHPLADLIILDAHKTVRHGGKVRTLSETRGRYWITRGLATVGKIIRRCVDCKKESAKEMPPFMAPLPRHRLQPHLPPFTNVGIDYFGPLEVVVGRRHEKLYGALFTCLVTRAIHLEMPHSLTADSFIAAFRRFANRRGMPAVVYSDNGTNLVAGEKEMREAIQQLNAYAEESFQLKGVEWHFSPPSAPHFGGAWERLVKSSKAAFKYVLQNLSVTDEILYTAFTEVEALLNGRPLTHVSVDPKDPVPFTPNHFLMGCPFPNLPIAVISPNERLTSKSWRRAQQIVDHFWRRWLREYVPALIERKKWTEKGRGLLVGDLVLVVDKKSARGTWPVGRITKVMPGKDGIVRTAVVQTQYGEYVRPAIKLFVFQETDVSPNVTT